MQTINRQESIKEAQLKLKAATLAHKRGDKALRDSFVQQARDRYQAAEQTGMVAYCDRLAKLD